MKIKSKVIVRIRNIILLYSLILLAGCTTFSPAQIDKKTGYIPIPLEWEITPTISKKIKLADYKKFAVIVVGKYDPIVYKRFWLDSIRNIGYFDEVLDKEGLSSLIFRKNLQEKAINSTDPFNLYKLQKLLGNFLVIKPTFIFKGGDYYSAEMQVINPKNDVILFKIKNDAFNFSGLDHPLFYPMLNAFIKWVQENDKNYKIITQ